MIVCTCSIASQFFDKREEAILDIFKTFTTFGLVQVVLTERPIIEILTVYSPAFLIGLVLENPAVIFTQRLRDLIWFVKQGRKDVRCLPGAENRTTKNSADGNFAQTLSQSFRLPFA